MVLNWDIPPVPKPRMTRRDVWKKRPVVERYYRFKDAVRAMAAKDKFELPEEYEIIFYVEMPKSWSEKKKKEYDGKPHQQKPDLDNYVKAFQDALVDEDSYVYKLTASKFWKRHSSLCLIYVKKID